MEFGWTPEQVGQLDMDHHAYYRALFDEMARTAKESEATR